MNFTDTLLQGWHDDRAAVLRGPQVVTYRQLSALVQRLAGTFLSWDMQKGDRVGLWSENSPFFVAAYLAVIRAGLVVVPFQTDSTRETFNRIAREAGLRALLGSRRFSSRLIPWAHDLGLLFFSEVHLATLPEPTAVAFPEIDPVHDLAALMFTSGSTGIPKGVMVTHRNLEANTRDIVRYMGLTRTDRVMVILPFHYCFGLSLLHTHLMAGASLVLNNQFLYPEAILEDMLAKDCTGLAGVPATFQILLRKSRFKQMRFPALRWFQQAGGKLHDPFIKEIIQTFPRVQYFLMYGQTEATARLSFLPPERLADKLGSIGRGLSSTRLEVLKSDGCPVNPGSDDVGEIVATGDNITLGYWNDPVETAKFFKNGKLYTGDLARVDADGFIYIVERDREMIKSGGNRVSAKEVENVIAELPAVIEVAVIGVPHELLGEAIKAFVVVAPTAVLTADQVINHCRHRLPATKCPESVQFLPALPHNSSGKVTKPRLKELAAGQIRTR